MPKIQDEETKKHGDKLEALIDSTAPGKRRGGEQDDEAEDDAEGVEEDQDENEDVEYDDLEDRPDVPSTD